uniref:Uncharacterized protein n=1 Tax=Eptatretus burgeri TaxID=7764 RepID=A0A8C4Q488_EPTBU
MEAGKKEMANEIITAVEEIDKLGQGMKKVKEGQEQIKGEMRKNTRTIEQLKEEQGEIKKGLDVVKEECRARDEVITKTVKEMEQKAEEKTVELGKRIEKHEGETEEQFRTTGEEISKTNKEVEQVKEDLRKLLFETIGEKLSEVIKGKMEDMEGRLVKRVEAQGERQGVLLREQGGRICSLEVDCAQVGPVSQGGVGGLPDAGVCMPSLGRVEAVGSFGLMRAPGMTIPVDVQSASPMAWESKRDDVGHGQTRTGVVNSPGKWLGPCGSEAPLGLGRYTPPGVPWELEGGPQKDQACRYPVRWQDGLEGVHGPVPVC